MKKLNFSVLIIFALALLSARPVVATTRTSTGNGDWNTVATWTPSGVPGSADDVIIRAGDSVTVSATPANSVNSITFDATTAASHSLTVNAPASLTVATSINLQNAIGNNTAASLAGSGVINCSSVNVGGTTVPSGGNTNTSILTCAIYTLSISGNLAINAGLNVTADSLNIATFAMNSGSVSVGGSAAFSVGPGTAVPQQQFVYALLDMTGLPGTGTLTFSGGTPVTVSGGTGFRCNSGGAIFPAPIFGFYISGNGTTVVYSGAAQTVFPSDCYQNVVISGAGVKNWDRMGCVNLSLNGGATLAVNTYGGVSGDLNIGAGTTLDMTGATFLNLEGNWSNSGTFTPGMSAVNLSGSGLQTLTGTTTFSDLAANNPSGIGLASDQIVNGTLTLSSGNVTTGPNNLILGPNGSVSRPLTLGVWQGGFLGNFQKAFNAGVGQSFEFPLGNAADYTPVDISSLNVTAAGNLTASTVAGDHPSILSSGIDPVRSVNRYWALVQSGGTFGTYSATLNYGPADVDASADSSQFIVRQFSDTSTWLPCNINGPPTSTNITVSGLSGFGSFAIGDPKRDQTITFNSPGNQTYGVPPITLAATASSGLQVNYGVTGSATILGNTLTITGVGSVQITASQAGNASWNAATPVVQTISVAPAALTVSGITANNKTYDGNTVATLNPGIPVLIGVVSGDQVTLNTGGAVGSFADKLIGNGKMVSMTGLTLGGSSAGNYALVQPTTTANITAKGLTVSGVTANDKVYDGTTTAALNLGSAALVGVVLGDTVTPITGSATGAFADKNVGNAKGVAVSGIAIAGSDAGNYTLTQPTAAASITAATVTPSITASDKVYDGTATATIVNRTLTGVLNSDPVSLTGGVASFADKNIGSSKTVTATGLTLSGAGAGNYALQSTTATTTANITTRALLVSATGLDRVYDGTTTATVTLSDNRVTGDVFTDSYAAAAFDTRNVGTGKPVSVTAISISGADAGNYTANSSASTTANITPRPITVTAVADSKVYDGTSGSAGAPTITMGSLIGGDTGVWTQIFDTKNVGAGKALTPAGKVNDGNNGNNYSVTFNQNSAGAITARSLTVGATGVNKVYDGTTAATVTLSDNRVTGDVFTDSYAAAAFDSRNVGTGKPVSVEVERFVFLEEGWYGRVDACDIHDARLLIAYAAICQFTAHIALVSALSEADRYVAVQG